jgi:hypothetical protein
MSFISTILLPPTFIPFKNAKYIILIFRFKFEEPRSRASRNALAMRVQVIFTNRGEDFNRVSLL